MSIQFQRIDIHHDLAIAPAERLRYGRARNVCDLVAYVVLSEISQLRFAKALAL